MIERIMIFSGGGLLSIIQFGEDTASILTNWSEDISLSAMSLVALMLKEYYEKKTRVIIRGRWVAYIPEESGYIPMAKVRSSRYVASTIGFIRRVALELKDMPEESILISRKVIEIYEEHFRKKLSNVNII